MWDADSGKPLTAELKEIQDIAHTAFSHDGRYLVAASLSGTGRVWDTTTWNPVTPAWLHDEFSPSRPAGEWVQWAEFSPDDRYVTAASYDRTVRLWDIATGQALVAPLRHSESVRYAQFSPDGRWLLTAGDKRVQVWDTASGQPVTPPLFVNSWLGPPAFSEDGRSVSVINGEGTCRTWELAPGRAVATVAVHEGGIRDAVLNAKANVAITAGWDKRICIWELAPGGALKSAWTNDSEVRQCSADRDARHLVTWAEGGATRVWDTTTGQPLTPPLPHNSRVCYATLSPDGRQVLTAAEDRTLRLWDARTGHPLMPPMQSPNAPLYAEFSPDGKYIVTAGAIYSTAQAPFAAQLWDAHTGQPIGNPLVHQETIAHASFSPDGRQVVTASYDQTAQIWSTSTGRRVGKPLTHYDDSVSVGRAQFGPDGRRILTTSGVDGGVDTVRVWDADKCEPISALSQDTHRLSQARFSPDSRFVAAADNMPLAMATGESGFRVWDAATGRSVTPWLHTVSRIVSCEFSTDGHRLFTASKNGAVLSLALAPEGRSVGELTALAKLLSGRRLDPSSELISLDLPAVRVATDGVLDSLRSSLSPPLSRVTNESVQLWRSPRARYPSEFSTTPAQAPSWHEQRARECESDKDWFAARFHLNHLLRANPDDSKIRQRRGLAQKWLDQAKMPH